MGTFLEFVRRRCHRLQHLLLLAAFLVLKQKFLSRDYYLHNSRQGAPKTGLQPPIRRLSSSGFSQLVASKNGNLAKAEAK